MEEYKDKEITRRDMAEIAFEMKNEDGKDARARAHVDENRTLYAAPPTLAQFIPCLIYNATRDTIRLKIYCELGYVSPSPYPMFIMNGQWGAFLVAAGGAVVYVAKNEDGVEYQVVYSYDASVVPSLAYTEIEEKGHYKANDPWKTHSDFPHHDSGLSSFATIGLFILNNRLPVFEGIITLTNAWPNSPVEPPPKPPCSQPRLALLTPKMDQLAVSDEHEAEVDA
ncbi:hypothetical protein RND81_04G183500 [Saponaria officinalis]|uniref:Uncharacterized protein n=1 Tax=Saponaria officinalis TaxID=3572 RepID=A0AAW1LFR5_SAPOF